MTTISGIRTGAAGAIAGAGRGGAADGASATLHAIAADVAGTIARELGLAALDADGRRGGDCSAQDFYGIEAAAAALAANVGATASEAGEIARLLHLFAAAVAARVGAMPDARSVAEIVRLVDSPGEEQRDARGTILLLDRAVRELSA